MPPPQLPRDAPIVDVMHPVQVNLFVVLRNNCDLAVFDGFRRLLCQWFDLDEPLRRKPRFHHSAAAVALPYRDGVILLTNQETLLTQVVEHALARFVAIQSSIRTRILAHAGALIDHFNLRQIVAESSLKVIRIVRRSHFHRSRPKLRLRQIIRNNRNLPVHQRQQNFLPMQMLCSARLFHSRPQPCHPAWSPDA